MTTDAQKLPGAGKNSGESAAPHAVTDFDEGDHIDALLLKACRAADEAYDFWPLRRDRAEADVIGQARSIANARKARDLLTQAIAAYDAAGPPVCRCQPPA